MTGWVYHLDLSDQQVLVSQSCSWLPSPCFTLCMCFVKMHNASYSALVQNVWYAWLYWSGHGQSIWRGFLGLAWRGYEDDDCHHDSLRRLLIVIAEIGEWKFTNRSILIQTYLVHGTGVYTLDCIYTSIYMCIATIVCSIEIYMAWHKYMYIWAMTTM